MHHERLRFGLSPEHDILCCYDVFLWPGVFGAHPEDLKRGKNKKDGYITGADSPHLDRLLEILEFFDVRQISLQASFEQGEWQKHFITDQSWFDMRATILGFVSMARYIFADKDLVEEVDGKATRFLYPRMFSQVTSVFPVLFFSSTQVHEPFGGGHQGAPVLVNICK